MSYEEDYLEYQYFDNHELSILLKEGDGVFRVHQVIPKTSKTGNKMLEVMFMVTDSDGKEMPVFDYLVATPQDESGMKRLATKIKNIALSINKPELYAKGYKLKPVDLLGEKGRCLIKTQEDKTGQYLDKSVIAKYYIHTQAANEMAAEQVKQLDDEIPW